MKLFLIPATLTLSALCFSHVCRADTPREAIDKFCVSARKTVLLDGYCPAKFASAKSRSSIYEIADSMDCDAENYYGFYLLRKRYAISQDIPAVSVEEMNASFKKMKQAFDLFLIETSQTDAEKASLTGNGAEKFGFRLAELVKIPKTDGSESEWTSISALGPSAVTLFRQLDVSDFTSYPAHLISLNVDQMRSVKSAIFSGKNVNNVFITRNDPKGKPFSRPIKPNFANLNVERDSNDREIETLGTWCQIETKESQDVSFSADAPLTDKPICVFGRGNSKATDRMQAMAQLLGVKFRMTAVGGNLSPVYPALPRDIVELPSFVSACMPLAIRRATMMSRESDLMARCEAILCHAWKRLASNENDGEIKFEQLNPIEKSAMAFYASGAGIQATVSLAPLPSRLHEFVGQEQRLQIRVKYYTSEETKEPRRSLDIVATQPDGSRRTLMSISNMRYQQ